jgi:hypothetical protein
MMSDLHNRTLKMGLSIGQMVASVAGCFLFTRGFRLIAMDEAGSSTLSPVRAVSRSPKLWAGMDAALFLMAFVTNEALITIMALRH